MTHRKINPNNMDLQDTVNALQIIEAIHHVADDGSGLIKKSGAAVQREERELFPFYDWIVRLEETRCNISGRLRCIAVMDFFNVSCLRGRKTRRAATPISVSMLY